MLTVNIFQLEYDIGEPEKPVLLVPVSDSIKRERSSTLTRKSSANLVVQSRGSQLLINSPEMLNSLHGSKTNFDDVPGYSIVRYPIAVPVLDRRGDIRRGSVASDGKRRRGSIVTIQRQK